MRSAKPPLVNARRRFSVAADWLYACSIRSGSGVRASSVGASSFTMWPRKLGRSASPTCSIGAERGLPNWPAMRPILTTGVIAPYVRTTLIWSMIRSFSRIVIALKSLNDSAQSPAWSTKARPSATCASDARSVRASPAKTSGGCVRRRSTTRRASSASGHGGCCAAGVARHAEGVQAVSEVADMRRAVYRRPSPRAPDAERRRAAPRRAPDRGRQGIPN